MVPAIRWNFLGWFMVYAGIGAMDPFVPVLIDRLAGGVDSATLIGGLLGAYGMLLALTTPIAGRFSDRVGSERLFLIATPILAVIAACIGIAWSIPLLGGLMMVRAISQAGTGVVLYAHLAKHVPAGQRAVVMSLTPMSRNAAWLIAPGAAAAATGFGLAAVFWLAAVFFAGATVAAVLMYRASGRVAVSTH
jgi:MFS family permease